MYRTFDAFREASMKTIRTKLKPFVSLACCIAALVLVDWGLSEGLSRVSAGMDGLKKPTVAWVR